MTKIFLSTLLIFSQTTYQCPILLNFKTTSANYENSAYKVIYYLKT